MNNFNKGYKEGIEDAPKKVVVKEDPSAFGLLGATALVIAIMSLLGVSFYFLAYKEDKVEPTPSTTIIEQPEKETIIEKTIENTKEVVPVPQTNTEKETIKEVMPEVNLPAPSYSPSPEQSPKEDL